MTTKELYIKHKSGEISNQKFLYEVRRDSNLPWITNMTSYEDAVKILKNKGIINEADAKKYGDVEVISKTIDMVNPYEYSKGMNYELDMAMNPVRQDLDEEEVLAAQKKVLANITKDANYYTKLYAGLKPTEKIEGYKEIEIAGKNLEKGIKADMAGRKADGYIKKELKKDAKANVKDNLGDSEKAPKKPKGVEEFKDKGVTGSFKTIKEGIEEIIREKLAKKKLNEGEVVKTKYGNLNLTQDEDGWGYFFNWEKGGVKQGVQNYDFPSKEEAIKDFEKAIAQELTFRENKEKAKVKVGDIVIPNKGPHKGVKHKIIYVFSDGNFNIQPVGLKAKDIRYKLGAALAKPEDIELAEGEFKFRPTETDAPGMQARPDGYLKDKVKEHHNDPNFPIVKGLYELLDAIVADWGKEDLYHEVEDVVVAYIEPDATAVSKEAVKKIKDVLENYDVLEDYADLVNGIAVKEPGTGFRPGVDLGSSFEKFKASLKEKLKADAKVKQVKEKKDKPLDEGALDNQIASLEKVVAQKKKETADAEKKVADMKAKEASAEAQG